MRGEKHFGNKSKQLDLFYDKDGLKGQLETFKMTYDSKPQGSSYEN